MKKKNAFTLAEVLITLGVIGIVAAMTLPVLNQAINKKVRAEQIRTVKYKFTQATDKMAHLGLIGPYDSTAAFVAELQKHLKIAKVCTSSNLRSCWPYDTITLLDGKEYEVEKIQTGKNFQMKNSDTADYSSPNVGIITADGTPMILSYNTKCEALDPVKSYGWSTEDNKPVSNATSNCVAAVFEINGSKKPNKQNEDVALFNANGLGRACAIEVNGKCFGTAFMPTAITKAECESIKDDLGISTCYTNKDYWVGAAKSCGGVNNLPSMSDLALIAQLIYEGNPIIKDGYNPTRNLSYKAGTASSFGLPEPSFYLWSRSPASTGYAVYRYYAPDYTARIESSRANTGISAICVLD